MKPLLATRLTPPGSRGGGSAIHRRYDLVLGLALAGSALVGLILAGPLAALEADLLYVMGAAWAVSLVFLGTRTLACGLLSISGTYFAVFSIFHFGLVLVLALHLPLPGDIQFGLDHYWPSAEAVRVAVVASLLGLSATVAGSLLVRAWRPRARSHAIPHPREERALALVGFMLLAGSIVLWSYRVMEAGGATLFFGAYVEFLASTSAAGLSVLYFTLGLGLVLVEAVGETKLRVAAYGLFGLFAVVALPLGLRGEVLFPAVTALALRSRRTGLTLSKRHVWMVIALLCVIAWVREGRKVGLRGFGALALDLAPHSALAELGSSLRPVAEVVSWAQGGEPFLAGASYWAPFDRALYHVLPGWRRPDAFDDERLLNVVIQRRVSAIGFSPVAEAYRNFGMSGVVLFMGLVGALLAILDTSSNGTRTRALAGIALLPLLIFVRNNFTPVPLQIGMGLAAIWLASFAFRRRRSPRGSGLSAPASLDAKPGVS